MSTDSMEDILFDENKKLCKQLESANYKINILPMEVNSLKETLDIGH